MMIRLQGRVSVLTPHTALHIVQGAALYKPLPTGYGLAAIVGLNEPQTAKVVASVNNKERPVFVANINAPRQIVVAGEIQGMRNVLRPALERGARKAELLAVATLSRRLLLQPAAESLSSPYLEHHREALPLPPSADALHSGRACLDRTGFQIWPCDPSPGHPARSSTSASRPDGTPIQQELLRRNDLRPMSSCRCAIPECKYLKINGGS
jgi:hypothetical protein